MKVTTQTKVIVTTHVEHRGFVFTVDQLNRVTPIKGCGRSTHPSRDDMTEEYWNANKEAIRAEYKQVQDLMEVARAEVKASNCYVTSNVI